MGNCRTGSIPVSGTTKKVGYSAGFFADGWDRTRGYGGRLPPCFGGAPEGAGPLGSGAREMPGQRHHKIKVGSFADFFIC